MKNPTYLFRDGKSILIDASEVDARMADGWRDSPHAPTIEHEPATDPDPVSVTAPVPGPDPVTAPIPIPVPASEQLQQISDEPGDPNVPEVAPEQPQAATNAETPA